MSMRESVNKLLSAVIKELRLHREPIVNAVAKKAAEAKGEVYIDKISIEGHRTEGTEWKFNTVLSLEPKCGRCGAERAGDSSVPFKVFGDGCTECCDPADETPVE